MKYIVALITLLTISALPTSGICEDDVGLIDQYKIDRIIKENRIEMENIGLELEGKPLYTTVTPTPFSRKKMVLPLSMSVV